MLDGGQETRSNRDTEMSPLVRWFRVGVAVVLAVLALYHEMISRYIPLVWFVCHVPAALYISSALALVRPSKRGWWTATGAMTLLAVLSLAAWFPAERGARGMLTLLFERFDLVVSSCVLGFLFFARTQIVQPSAAIDSKQHAA